MNRVVVSLLWLIVLGQACVTRRVLRRAGTQSFKIEVVDEPSNGLGTKEAPLPYATFGNPVTMTITATAIGWDGKKDATYTGRVFLEARPGFVSPSEVNIENGSAEVEVSIANAFGQTRIWMEDCGQRLVPERECTEAERAQWKPECLLRFVPGTLATGITPALWFSQPSIVDMQETVDNTLSPLEPTQGDRCAALADPRYTDVTKLDLIRRSSLRRSLYVPKAGNSIRVTSGDMIITAIDNEGFYVTDVSEPALARSFNSIFVFNFNYPEGLQVGDRLIELQGSPTSFTGTTQLQNPFWIRDRTGPYPEKIPKPFLIEPDTYAKNIGRQGRNVKDALDLEKLEGGLVCMENLRLPYVKRDCDLNKNGGIERGGQNCKLLPAAPGEEAFIGCRALTRSNPRVDCSVDCDKESCTSSIRVNDNVEEKCCEEECYDDPTCFEASSFFNYQQFPLQVLGITPPDNDGDGNADDVDGDGKPDEVIQKIGISPSNAIPNFDPSKYVAEWEDNDAPTVTVIGNLVQVLSARPVWLIQPRGADDLILENGRCPRPEPVTR